MASRNDYRVSKIVVLCKDCGNDVGLYPARHQCSSDRKPYLPTLCSSTSDHFWADSEEVPDLIASTPSSVKRQASDSSMESGKWSFFKSSPPVKTEAEPSYFHGYTNKMKSSSSFTDLSEPMTPVSSNCGKKLWGRMKENEKWKELIAETSKKNETPSGKLWKRIIQATVSNQPEEYHDSGADSDDEDWEGETHVSRILREYHQSKNVPLPSWLYDDRVPSTLDTAPLKSISMQRSKTSSRNGRRLWQQDTIESAREIERQALRSNTTMSRTRSERIPSSSNYADRRHLLI